MSEHVTQWLSAYQDGELHGVRLHYVEAHLVKCEQCQAALDSLHDLSALLHQVPVPEFTSPERLAGQVNLRLPRIHPITPENRAWEVGWWMIPVSLLSVWLLILTVNWLGNVVVTADQLGLMETDSLGTIQLGSVQVDVLPDWLAPDTSNTWSGALAGFGFLRGDGLTWATTLERFVRNTLPQFVWQVAIAILYLGWIAIWWARQSQQEQGQLLEVTVRSSKTK